MLSKKDLGLLFDGKWGVENSVDVNNIISQINTLIAESNTILKNSKPNFADALEAQFADSTSLENARDTWCKKVDNLLTKVFHCNSSSVQVSFDMIKGESTMSKYVEVWQSINNKQNILDSVKTDLRNLTNND